MESTGKYWVPVWNALEDSIHVVIANPKWVSAVKGNKDDKKDSKWIGDLFRMGLVPSSYIPEKDIRVLREFTRYRSKLVSMRSSEKCRFQNAFTVCNLTILKTICLNPTPLTLTTAFLCFAVVLKRNPKRLLTQ